MSSALGNSSPNLTKNDQAMTQPNLENVRSMSGTGALTDVPRRH